MKVAISICTERASGISIYPCRCSHRDRRSERFSNPKLMSYKSLWGSLPVIIWTTMRMPFWRSLELSRSYSSKTSGEICQECHQHQEHWQHYEQVLNKCRHCFPFVNTPHVSLSLIKPRRTSMFPASCLPCTRLELKREWAARNFERPQAVVDSWMIGSLTNWILKLCIYALPNISSGAEIGNEFTVRLCFSAQCGSPVGSPALSWEPC